MIRRETVLSGGEHPGTKLEILQAANGAYYLGFRAKDGSPYSRESRYFNTKKGAQSLLDCLRYE